MPKKHSQKKKKKEQQGNEKKQNVSTKMKRIKSVVTVIEVEIGLTMARSHPTFAYHTME